MLQGGAYDDTFTIGVRSPGVCGDGRVLRGRASPVFRATGGHDGHLLVPGGSLALISHDVDDARPRPTGPGHPEVPRAAVRKLILGYLGDATRQYIATWNEGQPARFEDTLSQTRFGGSRTIYAPGRPDLIVDIDTVVASYFSLSYAAPRWFGDRRADFESDLRHLLHEHSPDGLFWDWPGDTEIVIATKS
jgi:hypothetical protein